ncbi:16S rRNA (cytosine(1402)-N(4))-methyltransferase RsmH [bacterium]|nr:16S rRNA (cytosine(1402)-N(4))-methyltransferase RsmH [bacterium]
MTVSHYPVLLKEVIESLNPLPNQNYVDGTVGLASHTIEILKRTSPQGKVLAIDLNKETLKIAKRRIKEKGLSKRVIFVQGNFAKIAEIVKKFHFSPVKGVLLDLGLSMFLIKESGLGFTFQKNEFLDMRYSPKETNLTASQVLNSYSFKELAEIFSSFGQEKKAREIAEEIVGQRKKEPINYTFQLKEIVERIYGFKRRKRIQPATKVFQALRIYLNKELENLKEGLKSSFAVLSPGGRMAVITFHSLEDKIVKQFYLEKKREGEGVIITKRPIKPKYQEIKINPPSRSAKLRVLEKI